MTLSTRPARAGDLSAVRRVAEAAYRPYVDRIGRPPAPMAADYADLIATGQLWVAEHAGAIAGLLVLCPEPDHLLLDNIAVHPEAQGQGVGRRLLDLAEQRARAAGYPEIRLYTNEAMTENLAYYPRQGYVETHRGVDDGFRRVYFRKRLPAGPELQRLRADHAPALLAFERENRAYFAASIPDRGDDYFTDFDSRHQALLAEQADGVCHFHVLVENGGSIVGRVNLVDVAGGSAELGYRIAERAAGRGLATRSVREMCARATSEYDLTELTAKTTLDNPGSRRVLERVGFAVVGEMTLNGRPGLRYAKSLDADE